MSINFWKMYEFPFIHWIYWFTREARWAVVDDFGTLAVVQEDQLMDHYMHALCDYYIMETRILTTEAGTWH